MNRKNYVSIKKVINDIAIKSGNKTDFNPDDILYLANGIAELIIPGDAYIEGLALIDIDNYKGILPSNLKYVSQALYYEEEDTHYESERVIEWSKNLYGTDCNLDVKLNCDSCYDGCRTKIITLDTDWNYLLKNPQWSYNHSKFFYGDRKLDKNKSCQLPIPKFKLMRRTTNNFFNIPYHINECINFNNDSLVEYSISYPNIITNFKKGTVLLAYLGVAMDEEGYRKIPDLEQVYDAIYYSIRERLAEQKFDNEPSQNNRIALQLAEAKAKEKRKIVKGKLSEVEPDEWEMFVRNHMVRTIPYYKWEKTGNRYIGDKAYTNIHTIGRF
jgi:hypothetical protein